MDLDQLDSFDVLTSHSVCRLQDVSGPRSVGLFRCPDKSLCLPSPGRQWASVGLIYLVVLTSRSVCRLQRVSGPRSVGLFGCPDKSLCLPSSGCEWASVGRILSVS